MTREMSGIFAKYCVEPFSKYTFAGILNHCMFTVRYATRFKLMRLTAVTLLVVEFDPYEPQPSVNEGKFVLYMSPIAPCVDGELMMIRPVCRRFA